MGSHMIHFTYSSNNKSFFFMVTALFPISINLDFRTCLNLNGNERCSGVDYNGDKVFGYLMDNGNCCYPAFCHEDDDDAPPCDVHACLKNRCCRKPCHNC